MTAPSKTAKVKQAAPPDERDATIERLERELAAERSTAATLRAAVDELRFKLEVVEKSYLKQLSDARVERDAAQQLVRDKEARLQALDATMAQTVELLQKTHEQLERLAIDHDRLCKELARRGGIIVPTSAATYVRSADDDLPSIDELLAAPTTARRPESDGHLTARVAPPVEQTIAEMLPAELVFPKGKEDDDEDD